MLVIKVLKLLKRVQARIKRKAIESQKNKLVRQAELIDSAIELEQVRMDFAVDLYASLVSRAHKISRESIRKCNSNKRAISDNLDELEVL